MQIDSPVGTLSGKGKLGYRIELRFSVCCLPSLPIRLGAPDARFFIIDSQ